MRYLPFLLVPALALAAPVPKPTETQKIEAKFGKVVDPKGDSKFALDGDKLTITLPANETRQFGHTSDPDEPENQAKFKKTNTCPRVEFEATGDFVLTVRMNLKLDAKAKEVSGRRDLAYVAAGVQVASGENDWFAFGPVQMRGIVTSSEYTFEMPGAFSEGVGTTVGDVTPVPDEVWIQLMRVKHTLNFSTSTDGKSFAVKFTSDKCPKDDTIRLSLVAQHSSDTAHTVTFDEFKVEPMKK